MKIPFFSKSIEAPSTNETKTIQGIQAWSVRWSSSVRLYPFSALVDHAEFFLSEKDAEDFALSLLKAFKLTRTAHKEILVKKDQ